MSKSPKCNRDFRVARQNTGFLNEMENGLIQVKIIQPGQGSRGFYTAKVLDETARAGLFDGVPIYRNGANTGQHQDADMDLVVGYIKKGTAEYIHDGSKGEGVYATACIFEPDRIRIAGFVDAIVLMTIHADGELYNDEDVTSSVKRIDKVHSIGIVMAAL